ncbi:BLUF domain-containing protein [Sphingomonas hankookensis]
MDQLVQGRIASNVLPCAIEPTLPANASHQQPFTLRKDSTPYQAFMRQLLYVSSKPPQQEVSVAHILMASRRNNDAAGVTGLLYTDGIRFLQVLEGERATVTTTFDRIKADPRHQAIVVLSDREVDEREFGKWAMAHRLATDSADTLDQKLTRLLRNAPDSIRQ